MAPQVEDSILRSVNYRIKNTPLRQLPKVLPFLTSQLVAGSCTLSNNEYATWLKTRISSLLQDRSQEGRWCAVVLAKTVLELGYPSVFYEDRERVGAWVRGLIDVLKKPGPVITKQCAIVAITKTFMLTWDHPTLVRELTTPNIPAFVSACLQHFQGATLLGTHLQKDLIGPVLECFHQLLPRHPTVFRSFSSAIREIALAALYNDPFGNNTIFTLPHEVKIAASRTLVLLHKCVQKGGGATEWENGVEDLLAQLHLTLDQVFRAVIEDWNPTTEGRPIITAVDELSDEPHAAANGRSGGPEWSGLRSGAQRVQSLLTLLKAYIATSSAASIRLPVGKVVDLLARILHLHSYSKAQLGNRYNANVGRDEREELFGLLPNIHVSALEVFDNLIQRLGPASMSFSAQFIDLLIWLFEDGSLDANVRTGIYACLSQVIQIVGPALEKPTIKGLSGIIKTCVKDLLPIEAPPATTEIIPTGLKTSSGPNGMALDMKSRTLTDAPAAMETGLQRAASDLLPGLLSTLPAESIPRDTRIQIDRTAVLLNHAEAMAASVLNPSPGKPSVLPIMSALSPQASITEAILRPRMPVISGRGQRDGSDHTDLENQADISDEDSDKLYPEELGTGEITDSRAWNPAQYGFSKSTPDPRLPDIEPDDSKKSSLNDNFDVSTKSRLSAQERHQSETQKREAAVHQELANANKRQRIEQKSPLTMDVVETGEEIRRTHSSTAVDAPSEIQDRDTPKTSEDEDESDFEMPQLVMRTDVGEDDSGDDYDDDD